MVNGNDLIKHNHWPYLYLTYVNPDMGFLKTECHLDLNSAYIILSERILEPFYENVCI